jgi:hypothetical protein
MEAVLTTRNKEQFINSLRQATAGFQKYFAKNPTVVLSGTPTETKAVLATFQAALDGIDKAGAAERAFHDAVAAQHAAITAAEATLEALKTLVNNQLGSTEAILGDFGFTVPKRQAPSEATKAAAVLKREATRKARGTAGKRQKAKIKGQVPEVAAGTAVAATTATTTKPA